MRGWGSGSTGSRSTQRRTHRSRQGFSIVTTRQKSLYQVITTDCRACDQSNGIMSSVDWHALLYEILLLGRTLSTSLMAPCSVLSRFLSLLVVRQVHDLVIKRVPHLEETSSGVILDLSLDAFLSILITPIGLVLIPLYNAHKRANSSVPFLMIEWAFLLTPRLALYALLWTLESVASGYDKKTVRQEVRSQVIETVPASSFPSKHMSWRC